MGRGAQPIPRSTSRGDRLRRRRPRGRGLLDLLQHQRPERVRAEHRCGGDATRATNGYTGGIRISTCRGSSPCAPTWISSRDRRSVEIRGSYRLRQSLRRSRSRDMHVSIPERVRVNRLDLPAHDVILEDEALGYRIFRLASSARARRGHRLRFRSHGAGPRLSQRRHRQSRSSTNGTYFTKRDFFPVIGYDDQRQLADADERRRARTGADSALPAVDDLAARRTTPRASDADWIDFETTVSTNSRPDRRHVGRAAAGMGRGRTALLPLPGRDTHPAPLRLRSATYQSRDSAWNGRRDRDLPSSRTCVNVGRMIDAAKKSLAYFTANFGPYQHRSLRIVEFPSYAP